MSINIRLCLYDILSYYRHLYLINHHSASRRLYIPTKNLRGQTVIVTSAATDISLDLSSPDDEKNFTRKN